jgi:hypothetical protein
MQQQTVSGVRTMRFCSVLALAFPAVLGVSGARAEQPLPPCHPNPTAAADEAAVRARGDVINLPGPLQDRLAQLANRPHTYLPLQVFAEADGASQLFQYYLLDTTGFQPNVFTSIFPGVNDHVQLTVTGGNCGLPTVGAVRIVLEPKPGLPTDPNNPRAFNDVFTDISPLFVINNESGWYEGWMIHDITVPNVAAPRNDGRAQFGTITQRDAAILSRMGTGNDVPGNIFTVDGRAPHFPSATDHFPDVQTNVVPLHVSMGAYNSMQQSDAHSYWEFNYQGTNWSTRSMNCRSPAAFRTISGKLLTPFRTARSVSCSQSFLARDRAAKRTSHKTSETTPAFRAIPISLTRTTASTPGANSANAVSRAVSPMRSISTFTNGWPRSSRRFETFNNGCSMPMRQR